MGRTRLDGDQSRRNEMQLTRATRQRLGVHTLGVGTPLMRTAPCEPAPSISTLTCIAGCRIEMASIAANSHYPSNRRLPISLDHQNDNRFVNSRRSLPVLPIRSGSPRHFYAAAEISKVSRRRIKAIHWRTTRRHCGELALQARPGHELTIQFVVDRVLNKLRVTIAERYGHPGAVEG